MSSVNDVGISPVLLQAISQSLKTSPKPVSSTSTQSMEPHDSSSNGNSADAEIMSNILQQSQPKIATSDSLVGSDAIKTMLKIKMAANAISKSMMNEDGSVKPVSTSASELAMANVLTALASQTSRDSVSASTSSAVEGSPTPREGVGTIVIPQGEGLVKVSKGRVTTVPKAIVTSMNIGGQNVLIQTASSGSRPGVSILSGLGDNLSTFTGDNKPGYTVIKTESKPLKTNGANLVESGDISGTSAEVNVGPPLQDICTSPVLADHSTVTVTDSLATSASPVVICYDTETESQSLQSVVGSTQQIIEHAGKRYIIHTPLQTSQEAAIQPTYIQMEEGGDYGDVASQEVVSQQEGGGVTISVPVYSEPGMSGVTGSPCPICGDNVSGFHYGIFTCESCKGFFKRTVQNKKTFLCHRQGECEITLENRKKCPACRFAKCLVMGMKLEAIRQDRTRGGRSSYSGVSPIGGETKAKRPVRPIQRRPSASGQNDSRLVTVLNYGDEATEKTFIPKPYVPQVLTDIMNLESLLCDDDIPATISGEDFSVVDPNVFLTLLQLCELKLYKIVRWARNLPYFANISTDDQILLLQNCWCELLALTMCWKSIHLTNEIIFFHGQAIDREKANILEVGDMFVKLLALVEHLKRLKLDQYECVALKVIILICPDIKGLTDAQKLGEQQARISQALETYTVGHYKQAPNKFGEVLLRLAELSRISCMLKDHLMSWMPPNTTSCGLLYELLKGENMKDLV